MDIIEEAIEQRADFIPSDNLKSETADNDIFNRVIGSLIKRQTTLIVGPRGCGKTHMMRYASLICQESNTKPFAAYVSFNRYYRLEPLLTTKIDAINLFHSWVLARIIVSSYSAVKKTTPNLTEDALSKGVNYLDIPSLTNVINQLEKGVSLTEEEQREARKLSIPNVKNIIDNLRVLSGRKRSILLLDDAALTLTPEYMKEFFDIFRTLKSSSISPKASVYPGTTEYGARFHPTQEGEFIPVWLSVEEASYSATMEEIAKKRIPNLADIPEEVKEYLKFAAFGIPRAFLGMMQEFLAGDFKTQQQGLNRIIQQHIEARIEEFQSIKLKSPKLKKLLESGERIFDTICEEVKVNNDKAIQTGNKQLRVGVSDADTNPYVERMFNLLIEAGLLFEIPETVSHGSQRGYTRYIPHLSALLNKKAFISKDKTASASAVIGIIKSPSTKHPLRRSISTLIGKDELSQLAFNLPPCGSCGMDRINQTQKFCHNCGSELIDVSTFEQCMSLAIHTVPGLTTWQMNKIKNEIPKFKNIGDFLSSQDPSKELRQADQIGIVRAEQIIKLVTGFVDDFLQ
ncbi:MAG: ABC-type branched-subunit amino acid transport system ATPase component [Oleiphilaceae bacterium]|jgi:ABC-type branched-subunit amino acid transport system ATPase component